MYLIGLPQQARIKSDVVGNDGSASNGAFDARLLRQTYQIHGITAPVLTTACAMLMYAEWHGE
ncbi:hypothetical protein, partial [Aeromonas caviae]|uniref:hypothetical protein n=1 Tax=Aeromonas caviae TaxID=648 RepID=UPI001CC7ACED